MSNLNLYTIHSNQPPPFSILSSKDHLHSLHWSFLFPHHHSTGSRDWKSRTRALRFASTSSLNRFYSTYHLLSSQSRQEPHLYTRATYHQLSSRTTSSSLSIFKRSWSETFWYKGSSRWWRSLGMENESWSGWSSQILSTRSHHGSSNRKPNDQRFIGIHERWS